MGQQVRESGVVWLLCEKCDRGYDDANQWTICPHAPLGTSPSDYCPRCDVLPSMYGGKCLCPEEDP